VRRLILLGGMAGFLLLALAVPQAFDGAGLTFGLAYLAIVVIHFGMFARASSLNVVQAIVGLVPFNLGTALLVLLGGALGGGAQYVLWALAVTIMWISPRLIDDSGFEIAPRHFVERHGLVLIIAIGESIIAVGAGAAELPLDLELAAATLLGLGLAACLWWSYFGSGEEEIAEESLERAPQRTRPRLALQAFGYAFYLLLLGVIAIAAALKVLPAHPFDALPDAKAVALGGGAALFLAGEAWFRATLRLGAAAERAVAALLALVTIPLGMEAGAAAQTAALIVLFVFMVVRTAGLPHAGAAAHDSY
jgi:low temperature requirement protein LtrA